MPKRKRDYSRKVFEEDEEFAPPLTEKRTRRVSDVIDSLGEPEMASQIQKTPSRSAKKETEVESPDQGYPTTPDSVKQFTPDWLRRKSDVIDALPQEEPYERFVCALSETSAKSSVSARMPTHQDADCYNMNHTNRGMCVVFNNEIFDTGFETREGSSKDAERIEKTFRNLDFEVEILHNLKYSDVCGKISELSEMDHTDNDCLCIFVLTHGLHNNLICAKDVAYNSDIVWKPFTADKCKTLAGKPKLFFFQACRGTKLDGGVMLHRNAQRSETDSAAVSYKIPTHSDFLIAHSSVDGFYSWRNAKLGTWYVQCLCDILDEHAETMDLLKVLTITARKIATEFASYHDVDPEQHDQKQVPSLTSMLIRDVYLKKKRKPQAN